MFCNKCGKQLETGASFCPYCGNEVRINGKSSKTNKNADIKRKKSRIILTCCVFTTIIIVSIVLISIFTEKDKSSMQDSNKVENNQPTEEPNAKEPTTDDKAKDSTPATAVETGDWKQAFIDYINPEELYIQTAGESFTELAKEEYATHPAYTLWDLNQDGIPEVICSYTQDDTSTGVLLSYNKFANSVMKYDCTGRDFSYSGKELKSHYWSSMSNVSYVYSINEDGSLKEEFFYYMKRGESGIEGYGRGTMKGQEEILEDISEDEYEQYNLKYSQTLELNLSYGELIQEIKNYSNN